MGVFMSDPAQDHGEDEIDEHGSGHAKPVDIFVNNRPVQMSDAHATGAEIKLAAGVPANFQLFDDKGHPVEDGKQVRLHDGDRFTAISGQDVS
jgi:hypothetical protein